MLVLSSSKMDMGRVSPEKKKKKKELENTCPAAASKKLLMKLFLHQFTLPLNHSGSLNPNTQSGIGRVGGLDVRFELSGAYIWRGREAELLASCC